MNDKNPFKKLPGSQTPEPGAPEVQISAVLKDLCPFIGNMPMPVRHQSNIFPAGGQTQQIVYALHPCVRGRCAFWNEESELCSVRMGMDSLARLEVILAPLANFFGKRSG